MQDRPQTLGLPPVADWKNDHLTGKASSEDQKGSIWASQRVVLKHPAIWVLAFASALMYVTRYAIDSWGILYLQEAKGYSLMLAGSVQMARTLTGMAGAVAFGFMSDKLFAAHRPPVNLIFGILELAGLFMIFFGPLGKPVFMTVGFSAVRVRRDRSRDVPRGAVRDRHRAQEGRGCRDGLHRASPTWARRSRSG